MIFHKPYKVTSEKRNIVKIQQKGRIAIYVVDFIYNTIKYNVFGKPKNSIKTIRDEIEFYSEDDAKQYINNVVKPSEEIDVESILYYRAALERIIFPKGYNDKFYIDNKISFLTNRDEIHKMQYTAYTENEEINNGMHYICITDNLKNLLDETNENLAKNETVITSYESTPFGLEEVEELQEKRNNLIDSEIERSKQYIDYLQKLKK